MSLLIWLPLIEDTKNYGAGPDLSFSGSPTFIDGGKISKKCLNGTNYIVDESTTIPQLLTTTNNYSMCAWIKTTATRCWNWSLGDGAGTTRGLWCDSNGAPHFAYNGSGAYSGSVAYADGQWHHICFTVKESNSRVYVDGIDCGGANNVKTDAVYGNRITLFQNYCSINDFRLYDHCLSAAEVHEIAQGLILHYKLDNNGWGNENLLLDTFTPVLHDQNIASGAVYRVKDIYTALQPVNTLFVENDLVTFSFDWEYTGDTASGNFRTEFGNVSPYVIGTVIKASGTRSATSNYIDISSTNLSGHVVVTYKVSAAAVNTGDTFKYFRIRKDNTPDGSVITFSNCKMERGDTATPWCPNTNDSIANILGYNDNQVHDCSGYNHNGIIIDAPQYINDSSPRYSTCLHFSGTSQKIKIDNLTTTGFGDSYTFTWWGKISDYSKMMWGFFNGVRLNGIFTGELWNTGDGSNNPLYIPNTTTQVTAPTRKIWHHWAMVGNGTKCYVYLDGELFGEAKTYKSISGTTIYINGWNYSTSYASDNFSISDFRIYCTPLLDNDIKMLYNMGMKIDNLSAIHTYEYIEENNEKLLHSGILKTNEMTENSYLSAKLIKNTGWQSSNFIEI